MSLFPEKYLFETIPEKAFKLRIQYPEIPEYITENLKYKLFKWQEEALINFLTYEAIKEREEDFAPTHLLFNMATGAGKTLVMAATILYYYKKGYRNFIFFVNQNNIVGKTEENLCNASHNKYLFAQNIVIDDQTVNIKKVNTFADFSDDIQIKFTSIHALHNDVYKVKEDNVFLEDLQQKNIIMLGDEAHHLNAQTIKNKGIQLEILEKKELSQDEIEKSWEHTVIELFLNKGSNSSLSYRGGAFANKNVLLEFTATVPEVKEVRVKYLSKTIIKFDLKDFLKAGYTKEINLVSSSFDQRKRILQALLFNWYRHKIASEKEIPNFKPVILFRSKTVDIAQQNNSVADFAFFKDLIKDLKPSDFDFLQEIDDSQFMAETPLYQKGQSRIIDVKRFISENASLKEVINYLKDAFIERNCIITNSKTNKTKKEKTDEETDRLLNSLEDKENHIRAIFTVQRLTEGWDVQNLFDIVRLYEGQNSGGSNKGKSGGATTSEVQLIGRGVRYCPFKYEETEANKRKFDADLNHELRVLEEFYFHSDNDERYLSELKKELKDKEWLPDTKVVKLFSLKKEFLDRNKNFQIFVNTRLPNKDQKQRALPKLQEDFIFAYKIENLSINETTIRLEKDETDKIKYVSGSNDFTTITTTLKDYEKHIIRKAINLHARKDNSIFRFCRLRDDLAITSMDEVLEERFFGDLKIEVLMAKTSYNGGLTKEGNLQNIPNEQKLKLLVRFFDKLGIELKQISNPYIGSEFSAEKLIKLFPEKSKSVLLDEKNTKLEAKLIAKKWYAFNAFHGTDEEQKLIEFLENIVGNFENQYAEVQLLRNEEVYKIYDFKTGRGFQPDFILLLKEKSQDLYYQVFIEPKGDQFKDEDGLFGKGKEGWKEKFLQEISEKHGTKNTLKAENNDYRLIGLPLYNKSNDSIFKNKVKEVFEIEL